MTNQKVIYICSASFILGILVGIASTHKRLQMKYIHRIAWLNITNKILSSGIQNYDRNVSFYKVRENALKNLLEPLLDYASNEAIMEYNNTVEFLEVMNVNGIELTEEEDYDEK